MDLVTDLTAEAVTFLSVFQDICKDQFKPRNLEDKRYKNLWQLDFEEIERYNCSTVQRDRIREIIFKSQQESGNGDEVTTKTVDCFFSITKSLLAWLKKEMKDDQEEEADEETSNKHTLLFTPYQWRRSIRSILYGDPRERANLAKILHYMPIQVILCLGGRSSNAYKQRLYQVWEPAAEKELVLLTGFEEKTSEQWWDDEFLGEKRRNRALKLLENDELILEELERLNNPVPFETFFNSELDEITHSRDKRGGDPANENLDMTTLKAASRDPLVRATDMKLVGLAFSGGGIRSATFNLGILQRLAELDILPRVDYMSTVSGGGYIGSWFATWIQRAGSVSKVADRLNTKKSADPMAEEVLPVRWLRMFSNYLNPDASIMSLDSWTVGITWLRNTIINQLILLLMLCTFLSFIDLLFSWWITPIIPFGDSVSNIVWWSSGILITGCVLSGLGMRMYDQSQSRWQLFNLGKYKFLSLFLTIWAIITAFLISSWLFLYAGSEKAFDFVSAPLIASVFTCILTIAFLGNYHTYPASKWGKRLIVPLILVSSLIATVACVHLLQIVLRVFFYMCKATQITRYTGDDYSIPLFIVGIPLILEVISCTVIVRMIIMGNMFPDERREWWGRMGANVHRFMLIWILVTSCVLVLPGIIGNLNFYKTYFEEVPAIVAAWGAVIGYAVKLAFGSSTKEDTKNKQAWTVKDVFIRCAPYLFILGLLLIGTAVYKQITGYIMYYIVKWNLIENPEDHNTLVYLLTTTVLCIVTLALSWRIGVNEFSLHHFYRNRLVRAYLGATRRRPHRSKTANSFTGFDKLDDIKLAKFRADYEYYGPFPLLNATLNATVVTDLDRQDRKAESFVFSPLYSGFDMSPTRSASFSQNRVYDYGYRLTSQYAYQDGPNLGAAMAISGAAVNPNQGHHSSAATAFLLTIFNVRLGWWIGNPRLDTWRRSDPPMGIGYVISDLIGKSDINSDYVCLSDGGHFDNMGLYELIRRRCNYIILGDAEQDTKTTHQGLANAIRRCWIDFGVKIEEGFSPISKTDASNIKKTHTSVFTITYPEDLLATGTLIYIKSSVTGGEPIDIREYNLQNTEFPQESTGDQFFNEAQFESYRKLGYHSLDNFDFALPGMLIKD